MKICQTLWTCHKDLLTDSFGWLSPQHHLMAWAHSCLKLKELYPDLNFANKYLIAAYLQKENCEFERIIADWFEKGKPQKEAFFNDLQLDIDSPQVEEEFQKHEAWKEKTQLRATPTVLVNGYKLQGNYKIEDLRYFTEFSIDN